MIRENENIITIERLTKVYGLKRVLNEINLEVKRGQILGYIGPNGAGKSTTVKIMVGLLSDFTGRVEICGYNLNNSPLEIKKRIGYVPETTEFYDTLSPMEYLRFIARLHRIEEKKIEKRSLEMLRVFDLLDAKDHPILTLSKGMKQKIQIISSLIHDPELIVMDEPLSGLDANSAVMVKDILAGMVRLGKTVFYCSHVMDVVEKICDSIVILSKGEIIAQGSFEELNAMRKASSLERLFTQLTRPKEEDNKASMFIKAMHDIESSDD